MFLCFASSTSSAALYPSSLASSLTLMLLLFLSVASRRRHLRSGRFGRRFGRRRALRSLVRRRFSGGGTFSGGRRRRIAAQFVDIDFPGRKLRCQPHVAPALPDRLRELVLEDVDRRALLRLVEDHLRDFRGLQRVLDEFLRIVAPADDVDVLAVELVDDVPDAAAANADAGAEAVDAVVGRVDRDFRAIARLARDALDDDRTVADLGDFELEEAADEILMGARDVDADARAAPLDFAHVRAETVADPVILARDLVGLEHRGLGLLADPAGEMRAL